MEGTVFGSGDLFEFGVEDVVGDSDGEELNVYFTGVVGWTGYVVLRSTISDNNGNSRHLTNWSCSTSLTECLIGDVLNSSSSSGQSSQVLDVSDGSLKGFTIGIVVQSEFMTDLIRILNN